MSAPTVAEFLVKSGLIPVAADLFIESLDAPALGA
jgi:hypothetical protein